MSIKRFFTTSKPGDLIQEIIVVIEDKENNVHTRISTMLAGHIVVQNLEHSILSDKENYDYAANDGYIETALEKLMENLPKHDINTVANDPIGFASLNDYHRLVYNSVIAS